MLRDHTTCPEEQSYAEAPVVLGVCRPSVVRIDAAGHDDRTADRGESRCLWLPRVPWGVLGLPSCDSLHRPGYRALLPAALWAIRAEANSTWPVAHRGGWRSIATTNDLKIRASVSRVKSTAHEPQRYPTPSCAERQTPTALVGRRLTRPPPENSPGSQSSPAR